MTKNSAQLAYEKGYQHGKVDGYKLAKDVMGHTTLIPISFGFICGVVLSIFLSTIL
jgi:hypothetical protein